MSLRKKSQEAAVDEPKGEGWFVLGFVAAWVLALAGFGVMIAMGGKPQPGVKIVTIAMWLGMASLNAETFYTGVHTSRRGKVEIRRDESPAEFYLVATTHAVVAMVVATFFVGLAFFG